MKNSICLLAVLIAHLAIVVSQLSLVEEQLPLIPHTLEVAKPSRARSYGNILQLLPRANPSNVQKTSFSPSIKPLQEASSATSQQQIYASAQDKTKQLGRNPAAFLKTPLSKTGPAIGNAHQLSATKSQNSPSTTKSQSFQGQSRSKDGRTTTEHRARLNRATVSKGETVQTKRLCPRGNILSCLLPVVMPKEEKTIWQGLANAKSSASKILQGTKKSTEKIWQSTKKSTRKTWEGCKAYAKDCPYTCCGNMMTAAGLSLAGIAARPPGFCHEQCVTNTNWAAVALGVAGLGVGKIGEYKNWYKARRDKEELTNAQRYPERLETDVKKLQTTREVHNTNTRRIPISLGGRIIFTDPA